MRAIKALTVLAVLATVAWCGYWFVGARALDRAVANVLAEAPELSADGHRVRGFPNRFDVTLEGPRLVSDGVEWSAPFVQIFALSYRLNHLVAVFAPDQALSLDGRRATLHSRDLRASVVMEPGLDLPLDRFTLIGADLDLALDGATHGLDVLRLAGRRTGPTQHEIALVAEAVFPDSGWLARSDPEGLWPRRLDLLRLDAEIELSRPLDRHALASGGPHLTRLTLTGARIAWPGVGIDAAGRLTAGADGALSGDVVLTVSGWRALLARLRDQGVLTPDYHELLSTTLAPMAIGTEGDTIEAPLSVVSGDVYVGPLLLGTLPRI